MINNNFKFWPVGQGVFYTGQIGFLNFVYDCGTETKQVNINTLVDEYQNDFGVNHLDFVIISHLHTDHFSGLPYLLQKFHVDKIYLPYWPLDLNHLRFILAYSIFTESGFSVEEPFAKQLFDFMIKLYDRERNENDSFEIDWKRIHRNIVFLKEDIDQNTLANLTDVWAFHLFNKKFDDTLYKKLKTELETKEDLIRKITDLTLEKEDLKKIREIYEEVFGKKNLNSTSTILLHHPTKHPTDYLNWRDSLLISPYIFHPHIFSTYTRLLKNCATLLTGDAEIDENLYKEISIISNKFLVFQTPHHGSQKNWNIFAKGFYSDYCILNYGIDNSYHHPHGVVILDMLKAKNCIVSVTENDGFIYSFI